jgi:peroxiredoxin
MYVLSQVCVYADKNGGFIRLLGLDLAEPNAPKCQRFAGIMEDGILLKLVSKACSTVHTICTDENWL